MNPSDFFKDPSMQLAAQAVDREDEVQLQQVVSKGLVDVNARGAHGMTLLIWAMAGQKKRSMRTLLDLGADANAKLEDGDSPVTLAAGAADIELLRILLDGGGNPNARNKHGEPAIFEALDRSLWEHFDLLVKRGANLKEVDRQNQTVLLRMAAARV